MEWENNLHQLKVILENLSSPENLDSHPWIEYRFVRKACKQNPALLNLSKGRQLAEAVTGIFERLKPPRPPKRGLRLDTRWGEFGIIASQYFAPYKFGIPRPTSLREAWTHIDNAIVLFEFGHIENVPTDAREKFELVATEPEVAANSTISDWHRKGLEHLAGVIMHYEKSLADDEIHRSKRRTISKGRWLLVKKIAISVILIALLGSLIWSAFFTWRTYRHIRSIQTYSQQLLSQIRPSNNPAALLEAGEYLSLIRNEIEMLDDETAWFQKVAPYLSWIPRYGSTIAQTPSLIEMGKQLSIAGDEAYKVLEPILPSIENGSGINLAEILQKINENHARLFSTQSALERARAERQSIRTELLLTDLQLLFANEIDPLFTTMQDVFPVDDILSFARLIPRLLGAAGSGPQKYLIMVQNEDELRPTGGFFSAVGSLTLDNGELRHLEFESTEKFDDLAKPYPNAPWQLDEYMMAEILLLRDANWFTDFPTSVKWVRFLYSYKQPDQINGVFSIDQYVLLNLLQVAGPIQVEGENTLISAENVMGFMRTAKEEKPPTGVSIQDWDRKQFINRMAQPLVDKLMSMDSTSMEKLAYKLIDLLNEKHILVQMDDPQMNELITRRGWDGSFKIPFNSDYLMSVESNVGINKTNAVVQIFSEYSVDLSDPQTPTAQYTVTHVNDSENQKECIQAQLTERQSQAEREYRINDCYWSYLRVYLPAGSRLISSTPHPVPANWPLREKEIPARIDILDEKIPGIQTYGTLLVVPGKDTLTTSLKYILPYSVLTFDRENSMYKYHLIIQKQPGTYANPINIRIIPPRGYSILPENSREWTFTPEGMILSSTLLRDLEMEIVLGKTSQ